MSLMPERRFDDKEVAQILGRASAEQAESSDVASAMGVTLAELQRIAEEVGIRPGRIEVAAKELDQKRQVRVEKANDSLLVEQTVPGEITEEIWEQFISEGRGFAGKAGQASLNGKVHEWQCSNETESVLITATSRNGRIGIKVLADSAGYTGVLSAIGVVCGILFSLIPMAAAIKMKVMGPLPIAAMMVAIMAIIAAVTTAACHRHRVAFRARVDGLMDRLAAIAAEGQEAPQLLAQPTVSADEVRLSELTG